MLLALALIFLPIIFDGQGSYQDTIASRIPDPPVVAILQQPLQSRPVVVADTPEIELPPRQPEAAAPVVDDVVEITTSEPAFTRTVPNLDSSGLPQGWSVRLGSFSDSANASNLLQRLQASGYKAYSREISSDQGELTGIYVGPWLDRARTDEYLQQLQTEFQLSGMVVRYEVEQL